MTQILFYRADIAIKTPQLAQCAELAVICSDRGLISVTVVMGPPRLPTLLAVISPALAAEVGQQSSE